MRWEFDPNIPTSDFFEAGSLDDSGNLQEAVENFLFALEQGHFLTWEAVVCEEQGLPLTSLQQQALDSLLSSGDPDDDQVLYLDGLPRPSEPWHVILNKIVPHLLIEPFRTSDVYREVQWDEWKRIMIALEEHGLDLSLPPGVDSYKEVVPADLRHKLWLQLCFDTLSGLGYQEELTLQNPRQDSRIEEFIDNLRNHQDSVAHLGLTLESLLTRVILPDRDKPLFITMMQDKLGLKSSEEPFAAHL
ncbi:MAG: hypothetical protein K8U57_37540 [Planctomycetes bacterium]|nr:hypothetical protein [Planctomycetota bacterium]